ncbi:MAG: phosphatidylserine decarboxylase [Archangium sp.]|nr:phosphatidylserine decarboxylase [Archangium sp.]
MRDQTFMTLMRLLPKSALSSVVGKATRLPVPAALHQQAMKFFARAYDVNLEEAEGTIADYPTFGSFFTRKLKPGRRTIDMGQNVIASPVDAHVSQIGQIERGGCLQAKGISFPVDKLIGDARRALDFEGGSFATLYLAPRDYHRFHSPLAGTITGYHYLPGEFWPVNQASVRTKDALFAINERLVTWLDTPAGQCAYIAVGATCVARIHAAYDEIITHENQPEKNHTYPRAIPIEKGGEIGMFEMGSTVILLFQKGRVTWEPTLQPESPVVLGQRIGVLK